MKGKIITNDNSNNLTDFLEDNYPHILKSIQSEDYILEYEEFMEFHEITSGGDVVGFMTLNDSHLINTRVISEIFIQKQHRGKKLFYDSFLDLNQNSYYNIYFEKPTRSLIEALLSYGLAYKVNDHLVITGVNFSVYLKDLYTNSKLKRLYKKVTPDKGAVNYFADCYDLNFNSVLLHDNVEVIAKTYNDLIIIEPRKYDLKKYKGRKKLKKITPKYLENVDDELGFNIKEINDYFMALNEMFASDFKLDNILGSEDELKEDVAEFLAENDLTLEDGFKIRKSIDDALKEGEILPTSIKERFTFLISNKQFIEKKAERTFGCPFCGSMNFEDYGLCSKCGHDFGKEGNPLLNEDSPFDLDLFDDFNSPDSYLSRENAFSHRNNDFTTQFQDFNQKLNVLLGDSIDEFLESIHEGDFEKASELINQDPDFGGVDWYIEEGNKLDNGLMRLIEEKGYDSDEVFDAQCEICTYEFVKHVNENITSWKMDSYPSLNHVDFDVDEEVRRRGYVKEIYSYEFEDYFDRYSTEELIEELKYFDIKPEKSKEDILKQFKGEGEYSLIVTEEGLDYLNANPLNDFFATNLSEYIFYEFRKYCSENEGSHEELSRKFVNEEFKNDIKKGRIDGYLRYLDYYYNIEMTAKNYGEALRYLIQRLIYEVNSWYLKDSHMHFEMAISFKTGRYFNDMSLLDENFELEEIYDRAFSDFKFAHMKNNREKIYDFLEKLMSGVHLMDINDDLLEEYFGDENK